MVFPPLVVAVKVDLLIWIDKDTKSHLCFFCTRHCVQELIFVFVFEV